VAFAVKFAAGAAALAVLGAASSAWAIKPPPTLIDWTLSDGTFDDGGTFSGTFIFNTVTDTITSWNISTTALVDDTSGGLVGGSFVPLIYSSPGGCLFIFCSSASDNGSGPTFENDIVFLSTTFNLTNITLGAPGVVDSLTGNESGFAFPIGPFSHDVTGGTAVGVAGVPEPAAWALMILGFGGVGATLRRRRTVSAIA
jgi:hypothetical protein